MKVGKPKSKRVPVRLRHKIEKASAAKQRKQRKLARKDPQWRSRLKKDPGIPNLFPYKDKVLHEIEESKRRKEEQKLKAREDAKARRADLAGQTPIVEAPEDEDEELLDYDVSEEEGDEDAMMEDDDSNPMAALLASAKAQAAKFDKHDPTSVEFGDDNEASDWSGIDEDTEPSAGSNRLDNSRRAFDKHFKQVVASADVILYILDARDPEGTRSREVEREVMASPNKRLLLILNKIDLVPPPVLKDWLVLLRRSFPTLPLRASTASSSAAIFDHKTLTPQRTTATLLKALKTYAATNSTGQKAKQGSITIGVLGYPNVGKSSVVSALAAQLGRHRGNVALTGAEAGLTTSVREVKIDSKLRMLDSPGIVFPSSSSSSSGSASRSEASTRSNSTDARLDAQARLLLLNALPSNSPQYSDLAIPAVSLLLRRLAATTQPPSSSTSSSATSTSLSTPSKPQDQSLLQPLLNLYSIPALLSTAADQPHQPHQHATISDPTDKTTDFLLHVARKKGRLGRGGVPNLHAAAVAVLADWREGRIQGWVTPPPLVETSDMAMGGRGRAEKETEMGDTDIVGSGAGAGEGEGPGGEVVLANGDRKEIVTQWAAEFKIEGLWGDGEA